MLADFVRNTRCPSEVVEALAALDPSRILQAAPRAELKDLGSPLPEDPAEIFDFFRLERYQNRAGNSSTSPGSGSLVRRAYYLIRPLLPVGVRKHLQRMALRDWQKIPFPRWPVDTAVEDLEEAIWNELLALGDVDRLPFIWFWPEGRRMAATLTHDVETAAGRDFCGSLMAWESEFGLVSAFEVVPEERYEVPVEFLDSLRKGGCEVALHGLNHDGHLFDNEELFRGRAERINHYIRNWGARGFRSPVMYRRQEWLHHLDIAYDMSVPNAALLDPQRGGCCTVRPYFIGDVLELPLTTIQDYTLLSVLDDPTPGIWWKQWETIAAKGGLASFIIHPDYMTGEKGKALYRKLLARLAEAEESRDIWFALPGALNDWWRLRDGMNLVNGPDGWKIEGEGSEQARLAWAVRGDNGIGFEVEE
jgi:hypothetical protein